MKKKMLLGILLGVLLAAGNSFAYPSITISGDYNNSNLGGPFSVTGDLGNFFTFCVETSETLSIGGTYQVTDISHTVIGGGGTGNSNPPSGGTALSYAAAKLYLDWLGLPVTDVTTNNDYQTAIWYAEDEVGAISGNAKTLYDAADLASKDWKDYHGVVVLNLGTNNQSLLGLDPVPEPISMLLFGTGLVGVGGYIRRKIKR